MNYGLVGYTMPERAVPDSWEAWMQFRDAVMIGSGQRINLPEFERLERAYVLLRDRGLFDAAFVAAMDAAFQRFHNQRKPVNVSPVTIGCNLVEWTKAASTHRHPKSMMTRQVKDRPTYPRMIEPADRVRSKGGEITYVHGVPGPGDENRRYTP